MASIAQQGVLVKLYFEVPAKKSLMCARTMPIGLQEYMFKKLFKKWNAWREREHEGYDVSAEMDNIDWEAVLEDGVAFHENRHSLERNYPEYTWYNFDAEEERRAKEHEMALAELAKRPENEYEAEPYSAVPEEDMEPENSEDWQVEQTEDGEMHSIEVEIKPLFTKAKGKQYLYGRIQLSVDGNWIGLIAKINVLVPKI